MTPDFLLGVSFSSLCLQKKGSSHRPAVIPKAGQQRAHELREEGPDGTRVYLGRQLSHAAAGGFPHAVIVRLGLQRVVGHHLRPNARVSTLRMGARSPHL